MIFKQNDAIRIDWEKAIKEAELLFDKYKDTESAEIVCKIKQMYSKDDISGYLELLEQKRELLKGKNNDKLLDE